MAEDEGAEFPVAAYGSDVALPLASNSVGYWDGTRFHLRSFPVWYRWRQVPNLEFPTGKPESGSANGVDFEQTMGKMLLWYPLTGTLADLTEDDLLVEMSSWELKVSVGKDVQTQKGKVVGNKIDALCGDLYADIRRKLSWWEIVDDGLGVRWLVIHLTKLEHRAWEGPWFPGSMNMHRKMTFPWNKMVAPAPKLEEDKLSKVEPGEPQVDKELCTGIPPERLCTGIDEEEDAWSAFVVIHLDEEAVEVATTRVPMEELFAADVQADCLEVFLRNEGLGLCWGRLEGLCVPELTTWQITSVRRKHLPKGSGIKCPAFYNPALRIKLVKADGYQSLWGRVFADLQKPSFEPPRERMSWTERVQRALVLSPGAPLKNHIKAERAQSMCKRIECSQDTVTQRAHITLHLDDSLEEWAYKYKVDLTTFFALKVGERVVEVSVVADSEFTMVVGELGGACEPEKTTWEITRERDSPEDEKEHLALKIGLAKARSSRGRWVEVFRKMEPWEVTQRILQVADAAAADALPDAAAPAVPVNEAH